jgi:hypothetical protein
MASTWGTNTWGSNEWQDNVITVSLTAPESASALGTPQSFNVEGWGRQSYGNSGWGVEYSVKPSGVSATTSLGTIEASQIITVELTGLEANSNLGSISINSEVTLSGQSATVSLGTTESFNETGWGRLTWNTADWGEGADETISVTGFEATASPGSITPAFTYLLEMIGANHSMTTSVGTVDVDAERGVPVTGVEATFATPTLSYAGTLVGWGRDGWSDLSWGESPNQVIPLVGREATASVGSLTPADVIGLSGQEATTSVGSFSFVISPTVSLTGQQSTISQGTLGLEFGPASISGVSSTASPGTLGLEFGPAEITGVSATTSIGTLEIGPVTLVDLTGVAATPAVGSLTPADVVGLTGISATSATGSIAPADVVGLSLDAINALQGEGGVQAFANINTGSNGSFSNIDTGSNTSYSDASTGSNSSYSDQSTGSNSSYSNVATGSNTSYSDAA